MNHFYTYCLGVSLVLGQVAAIVLALRGTKVSKENASNINDLQLTTVENQKKIDDFHSTTMTILRGSKNGT